MEQEKNKNGVNLFLIFVIAILAVLCILFATGTISLKKDTVDNNQNSNSNVQYSYSEMKGLYKYTTGNDTYQLYLYDNGTYVFDLSVPYSPNILLGNYIIENNTIKLNNLFRQGSGISVVLSSGNGTFIISNDKTIVAESSITENNINGKTFEKCTVDEERKFIEASDTKSSLDFTELLNTLK